MSWWYTFLRPWIARGYQPMPQVNPAAEWAIPLPIDLPNSALMAFCPTFAGAENAATQRAVLLELADQLQQNRSGLPPAILVVGMQYRPGERSLALERLAALAREIGPIGVAFAGFAMGEFGKVKSVNIALQVAQEHGADALLQVDDDIQLRPGCITALYRAYRDHGSGLAVGATKIGLSRQNRASRLLRWLKQQTKAATNYPHACCMLIDPRLFDNGIPLRYVSDDGYICFSLLRPAAADPFHLLRLVPEAECTHYVGGPAGQSARRIRRMLLNHHIYLADFPVETARFYFRAILFPGFWPLGTRLAGFSPLRWVLQLFYFCWFLRTGLELAIRGLLNRPLHQIAWAGFEDRGRPDEGAATFQETGV